MRVLGIDVGGSGIKGAVVDTESGEFVVERLRLRTPQPATPESVAAMVGELVHHFEWTGPVGVGFPAVVQNGIVRTASNIDDSWIGVDVVRLFEELAPCKFAVANDADVAGIAEMKYGAGRDVDGVTLFLTVGTGIGSALFVGDRLVPNTEFGHLMVRGQKAEHLASARVRKEEELSWPRWARRFDRVLSAYATLLWPDRIIVGGGISKRSDRFLPLMDPGVEVLAAETRNLAGILGAGLLAESAMSEG